MSEEEEKTKEELQKEEEERQQRKLEWEARFRGRFIHALRQKPPIGDEERNPL